MQLWILCIYLCDMIDELEIKIGNWVQLHSNGYFQIKKYHFNKCDFGLLNPIPLTPTILEKCGFTEKLSEQHQDTWIFQPEFENIEYRVIEFPVNSWIVSKGFFSWNDELATIKYLHQLQNIIYVIGGIELNIQL